VALGTGCRRPAAPSGRCS